MSDRDRLVRLQPVRDALVGYGGGFLRNVRWEVGVTCSLCSGIPGATYTTCYNCSSWNLRLDLADRLGFSTYAMKGTQSGQVMHGYKAQPPSEANRRLVNLLHHYTVLRHWDCLHGSTLGPVTHWSTVPSLARRTGIHPLRELAHPLLSQSLSFVDLQPATGAASTRGLRPENFAGRVPRGAHVLLVEDTWVGGGHLQSAAAALKLAGAAAVTALILARWLDPSWGNTAAFARTLVNDYDPDLCPFTGTAC